MNATDAIAAAIAKAQSSSGGRQVQFHPYQVPAEVLALETVSAQIRALMYLGWPDMVIAKSLGKRNQHVRGTLENTDGAIPNTTRKANWAKVQKDFSPKSA